ncbi:DEDD exonuclease domain-containing protein [Nocardioides sp. Y6]|uniref:DEDD exonuclease domain-containing protein n=1 Tax=Nocardioides malaquae TaxID=2773426 RepID=A0ABR9RNY9_9ACTN|nr:DEDD exonuclease domain-containing protein [Nocardioides malaquae]MBE7323289.1 DEDD exonuclease domain-containing protein [Nocardioides malaquae]
MSTAVDHFSPALPLAWEAQQGFDDLGRPLSDITFTVVDLETTGGSPALGSMITEVGAVKVRGGEVLGEFQTLVDPQSSIPVAIQALTGITDSMVAGRPAISSVLPAFLEFAAGTVLVAHNAAFDVGFLKHFAKELGHPWPRFEVLDTVKLARRLVPRDEAPNCKLGTLAQLFNATTTPNHRALADARATVDVLHALIARVGGQGVHTLEELRAWSTKVSPAQRRKRHLADGLPSSPGVYLFVDATGRVLYVGTSKDVARRVRTYFTASETRSRMGEMVAVTEEVRAVECASPLEAQVRELRLIAQHKPPYNRRSKFPEKEWFLKLTTGPWPRLSVVRSVRDDGASYLGPLSSRKVADRCLATLHDVFPLRQCSQNLRPEPTGVACVLAELGRCLSPCDGSVDRASYDAVVEQVRNVLTSDPGPVVDRARSVMDEYARAERFEEASRRRDLLATFLRSVARSQSLSALAACREIVAARREERGWTVHVVRHGRLVAAGVIPAGADAHRFVDQLVAGAETVVPPIGPAACASGEESALVLRWLETPGTRLVRVDGTWSSPAAGAGRHRDLVTSLEASRLSATAFDERRQPRVAAV